MTAVVHYEWKGDPWATHLQGLYTATVPAPEIEAWGLDGLAYFCGECGDVWGRSWLETPQKHRPDYWHVRIQTCRVHGNGSFVNPLMEFDAFVQHADRAPRELLLHEFLCATSQPAKEPANAILPDR
jgi:hypothetical protein